MKNLLLFTALFLYCTTAFGQNINDNKVDFQYIQLPLIKVSGTQNYNIQINHAYLQANQDSLSLYEMRQQAAIQAYDQAMINYRNQCKSIERAYLTNMATWENNVNAGKLQANGQPFPQPATPAYPAEPKYPLLKAPRLNSEMNDDMVKNSIDIQGFTKGAGGATMTVTLQPIRNVRIIENKKGSGSSTKYYYSCEYELPIELTFATPTQGTLIQEVLFQQRKTYNMKDYKSQYEYKLYMLDNEDQFYAELETNARKNALEDLNNYINDQVGFVQRTRNTEIYSVKSFKKYDYTDITNAYSETVQALSLVGANRDYSGAQVKLSKALKMWNEIMQESNTYDNATRINDKISAMIQCNIAEIQAWQSDYNAAKATLNLVTNSGVLKGKIHANKMEGFYADQQKRWNANY